MEKKNYHKIKEQNDMEGTDLDRICARREEEKNVFLIFNYRCSFNMIIVLPGFSLGTRKATNARTHFHEIYDN